MILLLTSCSLLRDTFELTVVFPNADGLTTYSNVILNGLEIGQVKELKIGNSTEIITTLTFDKDYEFPTDTKFIVVKNLFGSGTVQIVPGTAKDIIKKGQRLTGEIEIKENTIKQASINILDDFSGLVKKQDSILIELRRLNNNLEKQNKNK